MLGQHDWNARPDLPAPMPDYPERHVETPAINDFLKSGLRLRGAAARAALAGLSKPRPELAPEESLPHRIMVCWRIVRRGASIKGLLGDDERMAEAFAGDPDPWTTPSLPILPPGATSPSRRTKLAEILLILQEDEGIPLAPPMDQPTARRWCAAQALLAKELCIERSEDGLLGLQGLLDAPSAHANFPTVPQILAFEDLMIEEATKVVVTSGERHTIQHFQFEYNMRRKETLGLIKMARARALDECSASVEENRAMIALYWKDFIHRARIEPAGLMHEARGLKELAKVQGITRAEPENNMTAFVKTVAEVAGAARTLALEKQAKSKIIEMGRPKADGQDLIADAAFEMMDDPNDAEALAEYDKENQ